MFLLGLNHPFRRFAPWLIVLGVLGAGTVVHAQGLSTPSMSTDFVPGPGDLSQMPDQMTPGPDVTGGGMGGMEAGMPLSLTPDQMEKLSEQYQGGSSTQDQFEEMCARVAAKHLADSDVEALGASLGLSSDEVEKLRSCAQQAGTSPSRTPQQKLQGMQNRDFIARQMQAQRMRQKKETSTIEQEFRNLASPLRQPEAPSPAHLEQFGYSVFSNPVSTFVPATNAPVSDDYILGPGDGLTIMMWGRMNETGKLAVERDGTILMPRIGPIPVAGLTFDQAKKLIESRIGQIEGVQVSVTMGTIRSMPVFVMGNVNQPGMYTISALSHVSNALVAAGGIAKAGTLRAIELRRADHTVTKIDLYNMLLHGDSSGDMRLEPRDVIFVPVIGPVVGLTGDVKTPGIYELLGETNLSAALKLAGGVSAFGYAQRVQVERIDNHQRRVALDVDLGSLGHLRVEVRDGDLVKVFPVLPQQQDVVVLKGNVNRPGTYEWRSGMRVSDLIREGEGISDHAYLDYATIRRRVPPTERVEYQAVDLGAALQSSSSVVDVALRPRDELMVFSDNDLSDVPTVAIRGAVRKPGTYPLSQGMRVSDLIYEAGGLKAEAYRRRGTLARTEVLDGGITHHSYLDVDIASALEQGNGDNLKLNRFDELFVQEASNWHKPWEVQIHGQVQRPGPYVIREGERLSELIYDSGGLRPDAYMPAIILERESVRNMQRVRLQESQQRLKQNLMMISLMPQPSNGGAPGDKAATLAMVEKILHESENQTPPGRVALNVTSLGLLRGTPSDLVLQNNDLIVIPRKPSSVNVLGEVYSPTALIYEPNLRVRDYLERAGGVAETGDVDHIFVVKANGAITTNVSYQEERKSTIFPALPLISGGLMDAYLQPGDTIFVPQKVIFMTPLQYAKDITTVVANSVQGLAIIGILASQI